jgi:hypothetical protein
MATKATRKHILLAVPLVLGGAVFLASGLPSLVATVFYAGIAQSLFPSSVSWDGHGAYVKCDGAIADTARWPSTPAAACQAMHMCVNEATLSASQHQALAETMRKTPGCEAP